MKATNGTSSRAVSQTLNVLLKVLIHLVWVALLLRLMAKLLQRPPTETIWCFCGGTGCIKTSGVRGTCEPDLIGVKRVFHENFEGGWELGAQLAVYRNGRLAINLVGGNTSALDCQAKAPASPLTDSDLLPVFSTSKVVESLSVAMLVGSGHLRYNASIAEYWPEFSSHNKSDISVQQLMQHRGGLLILDRPIPRSMMIYDDHFDRLAVFLANQKTDKKGVQIYHAMTRGLFTAQLINRVDTEHRYFRHFVRDQIARKLNVDLVFNASQVPSRVACTAVSENQFSALLQLLLPSAITSLFLRGNSALDVNEKQWLINYILNRNKFRDSIQIYEGMDELMKKQGLSSANSADFRSIDNPADSMFTNAKSMAKVGAALANGGALPDPANPGGEIRLISAKALSEAMAFPADNTENTPGRIGGASPMTKMAAAATAAAIVATVTMKMGMTAAAATTAAAVAVMAAVAAADAAAQSDIADNGDGFHSKPLYTPAGWGVNVWSGLDSFEFGRISPGWYGWGGAGGGMFLWHPRKKLSFAFTSVGLWNKMRVLKILKALETSV